MPRLFHVSEIFGLDRFEPRPASPESGAGARPVVWAIEDRLLSNYLLPRECPRVTVHRPMEASPSPLFSPAETHLIAVEAAWLPRIQSCVLALYEFDPSPFRLLDRTAGYWVSEEPVTPLSEHRLGEVVPALMSRGVELRLLGSLWPLRDAVVASGLPFSLIRMRNAKPRQTDRLAQI